jgi:hypothetical protein
MQMYDLAREKPNFGAAKAENACIILMSRDRIGVKTKLI